jgi:hypothetical protein
MVVKDLENIFAKHNVNEEIHLKKIKAYKQVYQNFAYQILMQSSQYIINNFKLKDQGVGLVEEALELETQTIIITQDMGGGCENTKIELTKEWCLDSRKNIDHSRSTCTIVTLGHLCSPTIITKEST